MLLMCKKIMYLSFNVPKYIIQNVSSYQEGIVAQHGSQEQQVRNMIWITIFSKHFFVV